MRVRSMLFIPVFTWSVKFLTRSSGWSETPDLSSDPAFVAVENGDHRAAVRDQQARPTPIRKPRIVCSPLEMYSVRFLSGSSHRSRNSVKPIRVPTVRTARLRPSHCGVMHVQVCLPAQRGDHLLHHLPRLRGALVGQHFLRLARRRWPNGRSQTQQPGACTPLSRNIQPHRIILHLYGRAYVIKVAKPGIRGDLLCRLCALEPRGRQTDCETRTRLRQRLLPPAPCGRLIPLQSAASHRILSGCHWTPRPSSSFRHSTASITPSGARAVTRRPRPGSSTDW